MDSSIETNTNTKSDKKKEAADPKIRPTGIEALDAVLNGGLPKSASVLLSGDAGAGKTTLAMQWLLAGCSEHDESGIYITMTEPTITLLRNLDGMSFYDGKYLASSDLNASNFETEIAARKGLHLIDLRQIMEEVGLLKSEYTYEDLDLLVETLFKLISHAKVQRVALDSITAVAYLLKDEAMIRSFIFKFGKYISLVNSNVLLISEAKKEEDSAFGVEEFITDGVIRLAYGVPEKNLPRTLKVKKLRGIAFNSKPVSYSITGDGLKFFMPMRKRLDFEVSEQRLPSGIPGFDKITKGGYIETSSILITGPSGSGKTLLALQSMVYSLQQGHKAIYFSFEESRGQILRNAKSFGWDLESYEKQGLLSMVVAHSEEFYHQEHISIVKNAIEDFKPKLVVIDSLSAIENAYSKEVIHDWATQIISLFKTNGVTGIFTDVTNEIIGSSRASDNALSSLFDQIVILRYVEIEAEFKHAILVLKMRGSHHDKKMYNLDFTDTGLKISHSYSGYEGIFSGSARQVSESAEKQLNELFIELLGPMGQQMFEREQAKGLQLSNVVNFIEDMATQGILSQENKEIFLSRSKYILKEGGAATEPKK